MNKKLKFFGLGAWYCALMALALGFFFPKSEAAPPPKPRIINYEFMADCVAEQGYVMQYHSTMAELERMLRVCGTFATNRPAGY